MNMFVTCCLGSMGRPVFTAEELDQWQNMFGRLCGSGSIRLSEPEGQKNSICGHVDRNSRNIKYVLPQYGGVGNKTQNYCVFPSVMIYCMRFDL